MNPDTVRGIKILNAERRCRETIFNDGTCRRTTEENLHVAGGKNSPAEG